MYGSCTFHIDGGNLRPWKRESLLKTGHSNTHTRAFLLFRAVDDGSAKSIRSLLHHDEKFDRVAEKERAAMK